MYSFNERIAKDASACESVPAGPTMSDYLKAQKVVSFCNLKTGEWVECNLDDPSIKVAAKIAGVKPATYCAKALALGYKPGLNYTRQIRNEIKNVKLR